MLTRGWDRQIDFKETYKLLVRHLKILREKKTYRNQKNLRKTGGIAKTIILLTQLRNLSRISEAHDAVTRWVGEDLKDRRVQVKVRKQERKGKLREAETRDVIIPVEVTEEDRMLMQPIIGHVTVQGCKDYAADHFPFNTHSLRYAGVSYLGRDLKQPAQIIAKITKHRSLDNIIKYTSQRVADEVLEGLGS